MLSLILAATLLFAFCIGPVHHHSAQDGPCVICHGGSAPVVRTVAPRTEPPPATAERIVDFAVPEVFVPVYFGGRSLRAPPEPANA